MTNAQRKQVKAAIDMDNAHVAREVPTDFPNDEGGQSVVVILESPDGTQAEIWPDGSRG